MREKPILFSTEMVRAILEDRKTQTRRVIKPQPGDHPDDDGYMSSILNRCPYQVGDILWVRETWAKDISGCPGGISYRADHIDPKGDGPANPMKWKPSIHMPKEAARLFLVVKDVRVERLQDITEEDAKMEGAYPAGEDWEYNCYRDGFITLWNGINGKKYPWEASPWVWVYSLERTEKPEATS